MKFPLRVCSLALSVLCVTAGLAYGQDFRVLYSEPLTLGAADVGEGTAATETALPRTVSFQAYGRQFDLELESNSRLLSGLAPERRRSLSRYQLLRGRLTGLTGSWVRLTTVGAELHGAIWDGTDLYFIAPARSVAPFSVTPLEVAGSASVVYRLSDTQSGLAARFCGVNATGKESTGLDGYNALVAELRSNAALMVVPGSQIEVAAIGDFEFYNRYQQDPEGALLAYMNIVDGIFSEQVGVTIVVPEVIVFNGAGDPFTMSSAAGLLHQLGEYRQSTPQVRDRGLAHLITGRDLDGNTAGIAYLGSLCEPFFGVSLSDDSFGNANTPLIAAHEIGHNFGAPHDAEAGSLCADVPPTFLMNPQLNGSSTFSQCSLDQMRPRIAAAACVTPSNIGDAEVVAPSTLNGLAGETVVYAVDVNSVGTGTVRDVVVDITFSGAGISIQSAAVPGGTCTIGGGGVNCQLGSLDAGISRRIEMGLRAAQAGTTDSLARLSASNDRDSSNNSAGTQIVFDTAADPRISLTASPINGLTRQPVSFAATVSSAGSQPANDVVATVRVPGMTLGTVVSTGGVCTQDNDSVTCSFGTMVATATHRIDMQYSATHSGNYTASASVTSTNDSNTQNNGAFASIMLAPSRDVTVRARTTQVTAPVNEPFTFSGDALSVGPEAVNDVIVFVNLPGQITVDVLSAENGTCTTQPVARCNFGTLPPGASRRIDVQARGTQVASTGGSFLAQAVDDDNSGNNIADMSFDIRQTSDVALHPFDSRTGLERHTFVSSTSLTSRGLNAATDVRVDVSLPASLTVVGASLSNGSCVVNASSATCTLASLAGGATANLRLDLRGDQVGRFTGTITAAASNDWDPANNVQTLTLDILPFFDAGVVLPTEPITASSNETFVIPITVATGPQAVQDVTVRVVLPGIGRYALASSTGGCVMPPALALVECTLGTLAANSSTQVSVGLVTSQAGTDSLPVMVNATSDNDPSNNAGNVSVIIVNRGDVALSLSATTFSATVNQPSAFPAITVSADRAVDEVVVDVWLPDSVQVEGVVGGGVCSGNIGVMTCRLGTVTPTTPVKILPTVRGTQSGRFSSTVSLRSSFDTNPQNNSQTVSLVIDSPPPPPAPQPPGGGGGGGAFGLLTLLGLITAVVRRRTQGSDLNLPSLC